MLFYSLRLHSRLPFYALGRQKILPGLKANFCCPALQFHRSYWQCKGNKNSWADQKNRGLDLHFWAPKFPFNIRLKSQISVNESEFAIKFGYIIYYYIYIIYILYIYSKSSVSAKISNLVTEIWDLRFWDDVFPYERLSFPEYGWLFLGLVI